MSENKPLVICNRYKMYPDGVVYDTQKGGDVPHWIFEFRNFVLKHSKEMKGGESE